MSGPSIYDKCERCDRLAYHDAETGPCVDCKQRDKDCAELSAAQTRIAELTKERDRLDKQVDFERNEHNKSIQAFGDAIKCGVLTGDQRAKLAYYCHQYLSRGIKGVWHDLATGIAAMINSLSALTEENERLKTERDELLSALDKMLVEVEPLRHKERQAIENAVVEKKQWADKYNASKHYNEEPWTFLTEFRRSLEDQMVPLQTAIREADAILIRHEKRVSESLPTTPANGA